MGRHRRDDDLPGDEQAGQSLEEQLWQRYKATKAELGTDSTQTFDAFFDWWEVT